MRRTLSTQRAWIDGGRVLAYRTAVELDLLKAHPDAKRHQAAQHWCSLDGSGVQRQQRMPAGLG